MAQVAPYDIGANKADMEQALRNATSCRERGETNGEAYFLRVAKFHFEDLAEAVSRTSNK